MALISSVQRTTPITIILAKELSSSRRQVSQVQSSISNIGKIIERKTKVKRDLVFRSSLLESRRREASKRREMEDALEASKVSTSPTKGLSVAQSSGKGPLGRILTFLGFLGAGWILENLPTWLAAGKAFIERIKLAINIMSGFVSNVWGVLKAFGNLLKSAGENVITLDLTDSSDRVKNSFDELNDTMETLGDQIRSGFIELMKPLGIDIPGLDEKRPDTEPRPESPVTEGTPSGETPSGGTGGGENQTRASYGTKEQRAMLDAIAWAEGGVSYRTMFGGGQFDTSQGWKHPDTVVRGGRYSSAAAGRYQFLPGTWAGAAKALGLKDFSPINQDKAAIYLMDRRLGGNSAEILRREGVSNRVLNAFAGEWAAVPMASGGSYYGQPARKVQDFKNKYDSLIKTTPEQAPSTQQPRSVPSQTSLPPLPKTNTIPNQYYGAPRDGGTRKHAGVDFDISGSGAKFYSRIGGIVVGSPFRYGEDGWAIDIYNKELGVYERIAEAARILVKPGQVIKPGDLVAQGESRTGVIHYEIRTKIQGGFENSLDPIAFLKSPRVQSQSSVASATPSAQISAPPPSSVPGSEITPERTGQEIVLIDQPRPPSDVMGAVGGKAPSAPTGGVSQVSEYNMLNNFIKNKLLLDLAYL